MSEEQESITVSYVVFVSFGADIWPADVRFIVFHAASGCLSEASDRGKDLLLHPESMNVTGLACVAVWFTDQQ